MKNIREQYKDLKEGKLSQANFMRNVRLSLPQYVTNLTSFEDTIKILKNKSIISEGKSKELHPNTIHPQELRMGIKVEMEHTDDPKKAEKIALDHLAENPFYYTALKLAGVESPSAPKAKAPKEAPKKAKKKDATEMVDKDNQMQKIKMPKVVKENLTEDHFNTKEDQIDYIVKSGAYAGSRDYLNKQTDEKVKQIYDRVENAVKGGNVGSSFEKFKSQLKEIIKEVVAEYYDGRDNLDAENEY